MLAAALMRATIALTMLSAGVKDSGLPTGAIASTALGLVASTIREMTPRDVVPGLPYLMMGGMEAKYLRQHSDRVFRFLAVSFADGDVARVHGVNGRMKVEEYAVAVGFFSHLLRGLDRLQ